MYRSDESDRAASTLWLGFLLAVLVMAMAVASSALGAESRWVLAVGTATTAAQTAVEIPVVLATNGQRVSAIAFSVDFDASKLALDADPKLGSKVEIPAPTMFTSSSWVAAEAGAIGVAVYDRTRPIGVLADGTIARIRFRVLPGATGFAPVRVSTAKPYSAAGPMGEALEGEIVPGGGITIAAPAGSSSAPPFEADGRAGRARPVERRPTEDLAVVIPLASEGARASLILHHGGSEPQRAQLMLLRNSALSPGARVQVSIPAGATRSWADPASELFGLPGASGAIVVERSSHHLLAASSRGAGESGPIASAAAVTDRDVRAVAVDDSQNIRSTVTIANLAPESSSFVVEIRDSEGGLVDSRLIEIEARSTTVELPLRYAGTPAGPNLTVLIRTASSNARFAAWVTTRAAGGQPVVQNAR